MIFGIKVKSAGKTARAARLVKTNLIILFLLVAGCSSASAQFKRYAIGIRGSLASLTGGDSAKFPLQKGYGGMVQYRPSERWTLSTGLTFFDLDNDTAETSSFSFSRNEANATQKWKASRVDFLASRPLLSLFNRIDLIYGFGGGLMIWKVVDPVADTALHRKGELNQTLSYAASEIFLSAAVGFEFGLGRNLSLRIGTRIDYLTGAGSEFAPAVESARDKQLIGSEALLSFSFGGHKEKWSSDENWSRTGTPILTSGAGVDSDGDGVPDQIDRCLNTFVGAVVDRFGCPVDSDNDGVIDGLDHCPNTDPRAVATIDIYGCATDSDFDGVPDYSDLCPHNTPGAWVDNSGCPTDADADGVPDGLDDCPHTLVGVDVDAEGCIDLSMLSKAMVLNIDYVSGSFEVDEKNKERLVQLSRLLNFVKNIRLEINGYTDNIGTTVANRRLSLKRARRVHDYLVTYGISSDRIKTFGRGEENFVADNQTSAGREKNRRVEIVFYR